MHPSVGIVVQCRALEPTLQFLTETVGLRVEKIFPADSPVQATLSGCGCRIHLEPGTPQPQVVRVEMDDPLPDGPRIEHGPDGLTIEFVPAHPPLILPTLESSLSLTHDDDPSRWHTGRAGMEYRDLIPDRQGGAVIASHIRIHGEGQVSDYVHFHDIVFQLIFCRRGSVTVVYEDQGDPIVLHAGDCVTQPPRIRHRVLDSADDLEVIEIGYPAEHITRSDPSTILPTKTIDAARVWDGQVFVHHRRSLAAQTERVDGVVLVDTGVAHGTRGLADVSEVDLAANATWTCPSADTGEFVMIFVLVGTCRGIVHDRVVTSTVELESGSTLVVPVGSSAELTSMDSAQLLHVRIRTT